MAPPIVELIELRHVGIAEIEAASIYQALADLAHQDPSSPSEVC